MEVREATVESGEKKSEEYATANATMRKIPAAAVTSHATRGPLRCESALVTLLFSPEGGFSATFARSDMYS